VAREALSYVPAGEERPRIAIETTEAWVNGRSSIEQARQSAYAAANAAVYAANAAYCAAYAAADAAYAADNVAANAACVSVVSASARFEFGSAKWIQARDAELIRLRQVVVNACMTFPVSG